jgi:hypothetical protein
MRRLLQTWLGLDALMVVLLFLGGGRREANAHPVLRNGKDDWY